MIDHYNLGNDTANGNGPSGNERSVRNISVRRTPRLSAVRASTLSAKFGVPISAIKQLKIGGSLDLAGDVAAKLIDAGYVTEFRKE